MTYLNAVAVWITLIATEWKDFPLLLPVSPCGTEPVYRKQLFVVIVTQKGPHDLDRLNVLIILQGEIQRTLNVLIILQGEYKGRSMYWLSYRGNTKDAQCTDYPTGGNRKDAQCTDYPTGGIQRTLNVLIILQGEYKGRSMYWLSYRDNGNWRILD